jgi:hypothetical protein
VDFAIRLIELQVQAAMEERERRLLSEMADLYNGAFDETVEYRVLQVLLFAKEPTSLTGLAGACGVGRRAILPGGSLRRVLEKLHEGGFIVNVGSQPQPRYSVREQDCSSDAFRKLYLNRTPPNEERPAESPQPVDNGPGGIRE